MNLTTDFQNIKQKQLEIQENLPNPIWGDT